MRLLKGAMIRQTKGEGFEHISEIYFHHGLFLFLRQRKEGD
jgi:hypothetical protein